MVNNNKWGFGVIVSLIVISLGIFLLVFFKNVTIEPQTVYTVYLDGRSIGNIVSKKSFEDYINVKEEELKNKYNVDTVYTPKGVEIKRILLMILLLIVMNRYIIKLLIIRNLLLRVMKLKLLVK